MPFFRTAKAELSVLLHLGRVIVLNLYATSLFLEQLLDTTGGIEVVNQSGAPPLPVFNYSFALT